MTFSNKIRFLEYVKEITAILGRLIMWTTMYMYTVITIRCGQLCVSPLKSNMKTHSSFFVRTKKVFVRCIIFFLFEQKRFKLILIEFSLLSTEIAYSVNDSFNKLYILLISFHFCVK